MSERIRDRLGYGLGASQGHSREGGVLLASVAEWPSGLVAPKDAPAGARGGTASPAPRVYGLAVGRRQPSTGGCHLLLEVHPLFFLSKCLLRNPPLKASASGPSVPGG